MQNRVSIFTLYEQIIQNVGSRIASEPDSFIIGTSTEELAEYYYDQVSYTPVEFDPERSITSEIKKQTKIIPAHQREGPFQNQGDLKYEYEYVSICMPIIPHPQWDAIKNFEPTRLDSNFFGADGLQWTSDAIHFDITIKGYNIHKTDDGIAKEVEQSIQWVRNKLAYIASDLDIKNKALKTHIIQSVNNRKKKIEQDQERHTSLLKKLNILVHRREDEPATQVRLNPKPLVHRVRPTPQQPEEYVLDEKKVLDIISVLDNQGRQFEKTPATYQKLDEGDLRNMILGSLSTIFEGAATGETFCAAGKTDIYLQLPKGNILSFEFKFWGGYKNYQETIDQLLSYLTWRMNYGVIVLLSKQKNFTNILQEGKKAIQEHPSYRGSFTEIRPSHFRSHHVLPTDENKQVQLHHLFYTIATT